MRRRKFLRQSILASGALMAAPYILPSGRLFAATGSRKANHVVFCLFAGGVRNIESMQKAEGNLMPNTLIGTESISADIAGGMTPLPAASNSKLQQLGTLYKEFRYKIGPTGHFNGHTTALTGNYSVNNVALRQPPAMPTVFEYYRKHSAASALNSWWVTDSLGPYPFLNFSNFDGYGAQYGANMIQPFNFFKPDSFNAIKTPKVFLDDEKEKAQNLRAFFDEQFRSITSNQQQSIINTEEDNLKLQAFINQTGQNFNFNPFGVGNATNGDMLNIGIAIEILKAFEPELLVVNMQAIDVGHNNFTEYCNNIRKADFALKKLWDAIQAIPGMSNDTVLIVAPEHGRNLEPNTLIDSFGRFALDHNNDEMSRQLFALILGPPGVIIQNQVISAEKGESIDIVPTIAHILGFDSDIPPGMLFGSTLQDAFV